MFYNCGELDDYRYIYDSNTGRCSLMLRGRIVSERIKAERIKNDFNFTKIRMLYNFIDVSPIKLGIINNLNDVVNLVFNLCDYKVQFSGYALYTGVRLNFRLLKIGNRQDRYLGSMYNYGRIDTETEIDMFSSGGFMIVLTFESIHDSLMVPSLNSFPKMRHIRILDKDYIGIPVPVQMLNYAVNVAREHNFKSLNAAFSGMFLDNLVRHGSSHVVSELKDENIKWWV